MKYNNITITKRNDKRYQTKLTVEDKTKYVYGNTLENCYQKYLTTINEIDLDYSFIDWVTQWKSIYKTTNKISTNRIIDSILKKYAVEFYERKITSIKPIEIIKQINNLINSNKLRQAQYLYTMYNDIFDKAQKNGIITNNPVRTINKPKYKPEEKHSLSHQEEELLLKLIQNTNFDKIIKFCLFQGTRIGEALALTYEDIDFTNKKIFITKTRNAQNEITTPKTDKSKRTIPLFNKTIELLSNNGKGLVFDLNYDNVQKFLKRIQKEHNINITSHTLRHTFATRCIEKGINIKQVSKWLGHSTITITNQIYTHINEDFENKEIELLES